MTNAAPYPLVLEPILKAKVWGGRKLEQFGKPLPESEPIGESWELADLDSTSTSGGGGDSAHSTITNGPLSGQTIRDALKQWGSQLIDESKLTPDGGFPLLVKYLDAREHLSVQVHPSPDYANTHEDAHLKTESWLILQADEGAMLYKGLKPGTTKDDLKQAIESSTVPDLLIAEPAVVGQCHTLPSGTVHALGAGVLVAEVQTPSDTTFRVYDWAKEYGRDGRELHIDQALECADFGSAPEPVSASTASAMGRTARTNVAQTNYYTMDLVTASCAAVDLSTDNVPLVIMLPKTMGASIASKSGAFNETELRAGQTVLIPASIAQDTQLRAGPDTLAVIATIGAGQR